MSIEKIIQHAAEKNPLGMKEALEEELRARIALALEAKMSEEDEEDEDEDEEDDEEELDEAVPAYSPAYIKTLKNKYDDKKVLSHSDKTEVNSIIDKSNIANLRQLASANIKHVSDTAKKYIKNNTPAV